MRGRFATVAAVVALAAPPTASAVVIDFDDIAAGATGGTGTLVNTRYQSQGVTFNDPRAFDYTKGSEADPAFPRSANVAVEGCVGIEFCTSPIRADFSTGQSLVRVWVGYSARLDAPVGVRMTAYNAGGATVGTANATFAASPNPTPIRTQLAVQLPSATIRRVDVALTGNGGGSLDLAVDDLEFSTAGPPPQCAASGVPGVVLTQPADGLTVQGDAFPLAGSVDGKGASITDAGVVVRSGGTDRPGTLYPSLIGSAGGPFGPTSFSGLLQLGVNEVTVSATNCKGAGTSAPRRVIRALPHPGPRPPACVPQLDHPAVHIVTGVDDLLSKLGPEDFKGQLVVPMTLSPLDLSGHADIELRPGVQLVGERGQLGRRPTIFDTTKAEHVLFRVPSPDVCVEGLRLIGPNSTHTREVPIVKAFEVVEDPGQYHAAGVEPVVINDMELGAWPGATVAVTGTAGPDTAESAWGAGREAKPTYSGPRMRPEDASKVRVENSYIHHNARPGSGYGVEVANASAFVTVIGNVFEYNRHSVTASGTSFSGYVATLNYMEASAYQYSSNHYWGPHLDIHGSAASGKGSHLGGIAGEYSLIADNTVRGTQRFGRVCPGNCHRRPAMTLRGRLTQGLDFKRNVIAVDQTTSIDRKGSTDADYNVRRAGNRYDTDNSARLAAGDFDGDGRTDALLTNGTGWFFSRAGIRPWELLRASPVLEPDLGFADITGDGATDVLERAVDGTIVVYANGFSDASALTQAPVPMRDIRFGDFDRDSRTDLFYTRAGQWQVWYAATRRWTPTQTSSAPLKDLLFGEFDAVPGTDVVAVRSGGWFVSSASTASYVRLNAKLRPTFADAVATDFDANGRTDIAWDDGGTWRYSPDGSKPAQRLRREEGEVDRLDQLLIGHFDGEPKPSVVAYAPFARDRFGIWRGVGSRTSFVVHSEQNMR